MRYKCDSGDFIVLNLLTNEPCINRANRGFNRKKCRANGKCSKHETFYGYIFFRWRTWFSLLQSMMRNHANICSWDLIISCVQSIYQYSLQWWQSNSDRKPTKKEGRKKQPPNTLECQWIMNKTNEWRVFAHYTYELDGVGGREKIIFLVSTHFEQDFPIEFRNISCTKFSILEIRLHIASSRCEEKAAGSERYCKITAKCSEFRH